MFIDYSWQFRVIRSQFSWNNETFSLFILSFVLQSWGHCSKGNCNLLSHSWHHAVLCYVCHSSQHHYPVLQCRDHYFWSLALLVLWVRVRVRFKDRVRVRVRPPGRLWNEPQKKHSDRQSGLFQIVRTQDTDYKPCGVVLGQPPAPKCISGGSQSSKWYWVILVTDKATKHYKEEYFRSSCYDSTARRLLQNVGKTRELSGFQENEDCREAQE